jgi:hypothetical protein
METSLVPIHETLSHQWAQASVSYAEMSPLFSEQGRTRVDAEAYFSYVAGENPRRTPLRGNRAIDGWKQARFEAIKGARF